MPCWSTCWSRSSRGREPGALAESAATREEGVRTLRAIAYITGGRYFAAHDTKTLLKVCQDIDRLERTEIQCFQYRRYYEAYPWLGLASFLLWGTVCGLER